MAAITSNGTGGGNWSATATWAGGVVPVSGTDTVSIAAGDTVNLDSAATTGSSLTVGTDPGTGGTAAVTIGTSGQTTTTQLIVNAGLTIRLRGDLTIVGQNAVDGVFSRLTLAAGSSLIMDPPSAGTYKFNFSYLAEIVSNGSSGSHCVIKTDTGRSGLAAIPVFLGGIPNTHTVWGGFTTHTYTDFADIGNATTFGVVVVRPDSNILGYATKSMIMTNCTFLRCNYWVSDDSATAYWTGLYQFNDNVWTSSVACSQFTFGGCAGFSMATAPTISVKEVRRNGFDIQVSLDGTNDITFDGNVFVGGIITGSNARWSSATMFNDNVVGNPTSNPLGLLKGSIKDIYFVNTNAFPGATAQMSAGTTVDGCIFEDVHNATSTYNLYFAGACTIKNCLVLAAGDGSCSGWLCITQTNTPIVVEHCMLWGGNDATWAMVVMGFAGAAGANQLTFRANIVYFPTGSSSTLAIAERGASSTYTLDAVTIAGYNCFLNPATGTVKTSAGGVTTGSVPGYNELEVTAVGSPLSGGNAQIGIGDLTATDPQFTDSTRNLGKWNQVVNSGTNSAAAALTALRLDPTLVPSMMAWVLAGYVPTNAALLGATYPGDPATTGANGLALNGTIGPLGIPVAVIDGTMTVTLGPDTLAGSASTTIAGSLAVTLSSDTFVGAAGVGIAGSMVITLSPDIFVGAATVGTIPVGSMVITLSPDIFVGNSGGLISYVSPTRATVLPEDSSISEIAPEKATVIQ